MTKIRKFTPILALLALYLSEERGKARWSEERKRGREEERKRGRAEERKSGREEERKRGRAEERKRGREEKRGKKSKRVREKRGRARERERKKRKEEDKRICWRKTGRRNLAILLWNMSSRTSDSTRPRPRDWHDNRSCVGG
jgi:hypothetical protein